MSVTHLYMSFMDLRRMMNSMKALLAFRQKCYLQACNSLSLYACCLIFRCLLLLWPSYDVCFLVIRLFEKQETDGFIKGTYFCYNWYPGRWLIWVLCCPPCGDRVQGESQGRNCKEGKGPDLGICSIYTST